MTLVKADRKELERGSRTRSPRSLFADEVLDEFIESGMDCARVEGFEEFGNKSQVGVALRNRLMTRKVKDVKCVTRKGQLYLYKEAEND